MVTVIIIAVILILTPLTNKMYTFLNKKLEFLEPYFVKTIWKNKTFTSCSSEV